MNKEIEKLKSEMSIQKTEIETVLNVVLRSIENIQTILSHQSSINDNLIKTVLELYDRVNPMVKILCSKKGGRIGAEGNNFGG